MRKLYTVESAYATFQSKIFDEETTTYYSKTLYVFDDRVNSTHFLLNYGNFKVLRFELDLSIIDEMRHRRWEYDHLTSYKKYLENSVGTQNFFIEKNIGDPSFYKSFPKFKKSALEYAAKVDKAITKIEEKASALFKSEW